MRARATQLLAVVGVLGLGVRRTYRLFASGALTLDLGTGRRVQPPGPLVTTISAPREVVFDLIAAPYLGRTPRAMADKLEVWERGNDMALAALWGAKTRVRALETTDLKARPEFWHPTTPQPF